jgi:hypothetical protein
MLLWADFLEGLQRMLGRPEREAQRVSDRPRLQQMEPRDAALRGMGWSAPLAAVALCFVYALSQSNALGGGFKLLAQLAALLLVPLLFHATEFITNVRFWDLSDRWDELAGWQRGVLGTSLVLLAGLIILSLAFSVGLSLITTA